MGIACFHAGARASPPRAQICCPCRTGPAGRAAVRNFAEQSARVPRTGSGKGRSGCRRSHMLWNCAARMSSPIGPPHAPRQRLAWVTAPESWREAQTFSCKHCKPNHFQGIVRYPSVWRLEGIPSPGKAELYLRLSLSQVKLSAFSLRLRRKKSGDPARDRSGTRLPGGVGRDPRGQHGPGPANRPTRHPARPGASSTFI